MFFDSICYIFCVYYFGSRNQPESNRQGGGGLLRLDKNDKKYFFFITRKKKCIFTTKIWILIFFPLLMESKPYLQRICQPIRSFKKNIFVFKANLKYMVIFVKILIFSKMVTIGSVEAEISAQSPKFFLF